MIDQNKLSENILKTGFDLEYKASRELEKNDWIVINSKYYVDDESERVREVDIVAYKSAKVDGVLVYTTLIISCKKSESNFWGILSKDKNLKDPNINWEPVDNWTNTPILNYYFQKKDWKKDYLKASKELKNQIFNADKHIFAFQEINKKNYSVQNDKAIYSSITSLIKAMSYETSNLPNRKKDVKCIYNFNLISLVDTSLINIHFNDIENECEIHSKLVNDQKYVGSFIANKEEIFSRIHFMNWDYFREKISNYNLLHQHNLDYIKRKIKEFYSDVLNDSEKYNLFKDSFLKDLNINITYLGFVEGYFQPHDVVYCDFRFSTENILIIELGGPEINSAYFQKLNDCEDLKIETSRLLKKHYRYELPWRFEEGLPF